ncbi:hypothetical protein WT19_14610 [Burkholderia stagnalis]|nr:hypothetical protein WT11_20015 [Burkholderia stagnalis]KVO35739.1 hypothetical protein WT17_26290 [Burkholderia stagnalis]KVO73676.1 hypothetical protein WT19_14610 [Burkholderia stagnalis]KVX60565.1 hypothetical protein WT33_18200 [Burkholderia stagnalis]KVX70692.1 hypothetical protein WT34_21500 [Burkholderia stagnalis]
MGCALLIEIVNRSELVRCFGHEFVEAIDVELSERARRLCGSVARIRAMGDGHLLISTATSKDSFEDRSMTDLSTTGWLLRLSGRRAPHSQAAWLAELRAKWVGVHDDVACLNEARRGRSSAEAVRRADFAITDAVMHAMKVDAFALVMSPVHTPDDERKVLYFDCTTWCRALEGDLSSPKAYLPSIARMGLMSHFDRYVLTRVLDLLARSPELNVGVSVSGHSLAEGLQWESLIDRLYKSPDLAARLVVEVYEGEKIGAGNARAFLDQIKTCGCRIAIDDYGLAYGVDVGIEIPEPDIVKIASAFIDAARCSEEALCRLRGLVELGASMARDVVVRGARGVADMAIVRDVGAGWAQGC